MPYKDPERKKEWERLHRPERLARRRELRRIERATQDTLRMAPKVEVGAAAVLIPAIAGGPVAVHSPRLGIAIGGLTPVSSAVLKKGWAWWVGCAVLIVALLFNKRNQQASESNQRKQSRKVGSSGTVQPNAVLRVSLTSF